MAIPDFESLMLPLLQYASDGQVRTLSDAVDALAHRFAVTEQELHLLLPSGRYPVFRSRVSWARTYLAKALLLECPVRGSFRITQRGAQVLQQNVSKVDTQFLRQYPEFLDFQKPASTKTGLKPKDAAGPTEVVTPPHDSRTPQELLEYSHLELDRSLAQDLLVQMEQCSPRFFETLVVDLLVAMGYGGSRDDAAQVVGKSGDEGIDGIIKEDRLGLDTVYIQAKKWNNGIPVSRPEVQKFVGALQGRHASKGVFITTTRFSEPAKEYVRNLNCRVILIDGEQLARYMIDYNIGVSLKQTYLVKQVDLDYFAEE